MSGGTIGLHRPYLGGQPLSQAEVKDAVEGMMRSLRQYVADMNITPNFADIMQNTPPEEIRIYQGIEIQELVPDKDLIEQELEIARGAEFFQLPTEVYRKRKELAEAKCLGASMGSSEADLNCRMPIILQISEEELRNRRARVPEVCLTEGIAMVPHIADPDHPATRAFNECSRDVLIGRR